MSPVLDAGLDLLAGTVPIIEAILAFGFLILVHELGHFFAAKSLGIRVERLSIGFGPQLFGFAFHGTLYRLAIFPLGGYVKLHGDVEDLEASADRESARMDPSGFLAQPPWKRAVVYISGAAVNFVAAIPLLTLTFSLGVNVAEPKIGSALTDDTLLYQAGLRAGDMVLEVNGKSVESFQELAEQLTFNENVRPVNLLVERDSEVLTIAVTEPGEIISRDTVLPFVTKRIGSIAKDSTASDSGLRVGDLIVSIDGRPVHHWDDISEAIQGNPDTTIEMVVERSDPEGMTESVTIMVPVSSSKTWMVGVRLSAIIGAVETDSPADKAGMKRDDRIAKFGGYAVRDYSAFEEALSQSSGQTLLLTLERDGNLIDVSVDVPADTANIGISPRHVPPALCPMPDSPAEKAGIQLGDVPIRCGDTDIESWNDFVMAIRALEGKETQLLVMRGGKEIALDIAPEKMPVGTLGISPQVAQRLVKYSFFKAIAAGTAKTFKLAHTTVYTVWKLIRADVSTKHLTGPLGIVYLVTVQAGEGLSYLFQFVGFISVNLAILNLLPLPILDGGQLLFLIIEKLRGRPLGLTAQSVAQYIGLALLLTLVLVATKNDLFNFLLQR